MRTLSFTLFLLLHTIASWGQASSDLARPSDMDTLDSEVLFNVVFSHTDVDTLNALSLDYVYLLQVGKTYTGYRDMQRILFDSIFYAHHNRISNHDFDIIADKIPYRLAFYYIHRNKEQNQFIESAVVFPNYLRTTDSTAHFNWQLHDDTMRVCGYLCQKATAAFRGRMWTAWWTPEIETDAGPWKLHGLPGLILRAEDNLGTHLMEAKEIRKQGLPFISLTLDMFRKVDRKTFFQKQRENAEDAAQAMIAAGMLQPSPDTPRRRGFLSFFEDE